MSGAPEFRNRHLLEMTRPHFRDTISRVICRGRSISLCLLAAVFLPLHSLAAEPATAPSPGELPVLPVVQLTVQPSRFLDHDNCVGNLLLRELQRQAVLIAARDELGLGTRDMVLRESFAPHGSGAVTTVLFESRIWRSEQAQICLARSDGKQPDKPYALADLQVDRPQNTCQQWVSFKISKNAMADYPEFVSQCETASRGDYLKALLAEKVLGDAQPNPVKWVAAGAADPDAIRRMRQMDVFSQYLAVRALHNQIRQDGASTQRETALVRAYANLAALTGSQWSQASKAFMARSLLYAERLAVHENSSSASLYARAYSRAFAGMHAAALMDLTTVAQRNEAGLTEPDWVPLIRAYCEYDLKPLETAIAIGPWQNRPLAVYLSAVVAGDGFVPAIQQAALRRANLHYPGMFVLAPQVAFEAYGSAQHPDQIVNQIPVVLVNTIKDVQFPPSIKINFQKIKPGTAGYRPIAKLRDQLSNFPGDTIEPSLGVLADLIEQQELVALVRWTAAAPNLNDPLAPRAIPATPQPPVDPSAIHAILDIHPWGPFVEALALGNDPSNQLGKTLARIKDRNMGPWVDEAINHLQALDHDSTSLEETWRHPADLSADTLVTDYSPHMAEARAINHNVEAFLLNLCKSSPHSATLMEAWMRSIPTDRISGEKSTCERTIQRVETEFTDRPGVLHAACDWCEACGDFERALGLLKQLDHLEPSSENCAETARILHHLGRRDEAIARVCRGIQIADDSTPTYELYRQAANYLIEARQYEAALTLLEQASADASSQSPQIWQTMARCYEAMGQLEDADECFRQQEAAYPACIGQHYLWAKRLGRQDVNDLRRKAAGYVHQPNDFVNPSASVCIANDQEQKALNLLRKSGSVETLDLAQVVVLATKLNNKSARTWALAQLANGVGDNRSFGLAFKSFVEAKELESAMQSFDVWADRQLDDEAAVDWYSLVGRYLVASGHVPEGKTYLTRAIHQFARERDGYFFAWRELQKLGEDPKALLASPATKPSL